MNSGATRSRWNRGAEGVPSSSLSRAADAPGRVRGAAELTREQAIALAERRYGARVVRTAVLEQGGRRLYVLRLISSGGKVWTVHIDALSGAEVALP